MNIKIHIEHIGGTLSELHDYLKSQESLITSSIEGKTLIDFIDRNADEYPDYPALRIHQLIVSIPLGIQCHGQNTEKFQKT